MASIKTLSWMRMKFKTKIYFQDFDFIFEPFKVDWDMFESWKHVYRYGGDEYEIFFDANSEKKMFWKHLSGCPWFYKNNPIVEENIREWHVFHYFFFNEHLGLYMCLIIRCIIFFNWKYVKMILFHIFYISISKQLKNI